MEKKLEKKFSIKKITGSREMSLAAILILLCTFVQFKNSAFLTPGMMESLFKNYAVTMIMALGMMCVLLIGGIDIAVGSTLGFSGMCASLMLRDNPGLPVMVVFLISVAVGTACGLLIGLVVSYGKVPPIIATLGGMYIFRGLAYLAADNEWVSAYQFSESYKNFAQKKYLGFGLVNNLIVITAVIYILFFLFLKWTRLGRKIYAVGSNPRAAEVSGIPVRGVKVMCYSLLGFLTGLCGAVYTSLYASAQGDMGTGLEMDVIAACVVGGVSLNGGRGSVAGVFLGALLMAVVGKTLPLIGISQFGQTAMKGLIILAAVILNILAQRTMDKNNRKSLGELSIATNHQSGRKQ